MVKLKGSLFLFLLPVLFFGCAYLEPLLGDLNVVSVAQETDIGNKMSADMPADILVTNQPEYNKRVDSAAFRLVSFLPRKDFDYRFYVIKDNTPNAFTIPGGRIYVHTGLLNLVTNDDELAAVIAHEIGHAYLRHPAKGITRQYGAEYLSQLLFKNKKGAFTDLAMQAAKGGVLSNYSRQDEYEADEVGFTLAKQAGFRPEGLRNFLKKIQTLASKDPLPFFSSHPPTPERISRLESFESGQLKPRFLFSPGET